MGGVALEHITATTYCFPRIQCPAIVALVITLLGAVLSFTCVPVTTKETRVQSDHQGKPHMPTTGSAPWSSTGDEGKTSQQVQGTQRGDGGSLLHFLLLIPRGSSWAWLWESGKPSH